MKTKPMRMRWEFVIAMAKRKLGLRVFGADELTPAAFAQWANSEPNLFPEPMDETQALWILANPDAFTDGEP